MVGIGDRHSPVPEAIPRIKKLSWGPGAPAITTTHCGTVYPLNPTTQVCWLELMVLVCSLMYSPPPDETVWVVA